MQHQKNPPLVVIRPVIHPQDVAIFWDSRVAGPMPVKGWKTVREVLQEGYKLPFERK